jgi:hypothetical protein
MTYLFTEVPSPNIEDKVAKDLVKLLLNGYSEQIERYISILARATEKIIDIPWHYTESANLSMMLQGLTRLDKLGRYTWITEVNITSDKRVDAMIIDKLTNDCYIIEAKFVWSSKKNFDDWSEVESDLNFYKKQVDKYAEMVTSDKGWHFNSVYSTIIIFDGFIAETENDYKNKRVEILKPGGENLKKVDFYQAWGLKNEYLVGLDEVCDKRGGNMYPAVMVYGKCNKHENK